MKSSLQESCSRYIQFAVAVKSWALHRRSAAKPRSNLISNSSRVLLNHPEDWHRAITGKWLQPCFLQLIPKTYNPELGLQLCFVITRALQRGVSPRPTHTAGEGLSASVTWSGHKDKSAELGKSHILPFTAFPPWFPALSRWGSSRLVRAAEQSLAPVSKVSFMVQGRAGRGYLFTSPVFTAHSSHPRTS